MVLLLSRVSNLSLQVGNICPKIADFVLVGAIVTVKLKHLFQHVLKILELRLRVLVQPSDLGFPSLPLCFEPSL